MASVAFCNVHHNFFATSLKGCVICCLVSLCLFFSLLVGSLLGTIYISTIYIYLL